MKTEIAYKCSSIEQVNTLLKWVYSLGFNWHGYEAAFHEQVILELKASFEEGEPFAFVYLRNNKNIFLGAAIRNEIVFIDQFPTFSELVKDLTTLMLGGFSCQESSF